MARKPDTPCSSCGTLLWSAATSAPAEARTCRACRAARRACADMAPCVECGQSFAAAWSGGKRRATCSEPCAKARAIRNVTLARAALPQRQAVERTCEVCTASYVASHGDQRTCGRACGVELRRREGSYKRPKAPVERWPYCWVYFADCPQCERLFTSSVPVVFCSDACRSARRRALRRERDRACRLQRPKTPRSCECGAAISGDRRRCDACTGEARRLRRARGKRRRRALKLGVASEPYSLAEIAERDAFCCQLCDLRVDMALVVPDFWAPTIDHRMPLAAGGDDTRANVQLAHFICNSRKGAMVLESAA